MSGTHDADGEPPRQRIDTENPRGPPVLAGLDVVTRSATGAALAAGSVQRTVHHRGIEAYRELRHGLVDSSRRRPGSDASAADRHADIDAQCDAFHDAVSEWWAVYEDGLAGALSTVRETTELNRRLLAGSVGLARPPADADAPSTRAPGGSAPTEATDELQTIEGIGPAYAERLREAGIDTVDALAAADPSIADEIDARGVDVGNWIDEAAARTG